MILSTKGPDCFLPATHSAYRFWSPAQWFPRPLWPKPSSPDAIPVVAASGGGATAAGSNMIGSGGQGRWGGRPGEAVASNGVVYVPSDGPTTAAYAPPAGTDTPVAGVEVQARPAPPPVPVFVAPQGAKAAAPSGVINTTFFQPPAVPAPLATAPASAFSSCPPNAADLRALARVEAARKVRQIQDDERLACAMQNVENEDDGPAHRGGDAWSSWQGPTPAEALLVQNVNHRQQFTRHTAAVTGGRQRSRATSQTRNRRRSASRMAARRSASAGVPSPRRSPAPSPSPPRSTDPPVVDEMGHGRSFGERWSDAESDEDKVQQPPRTRTPSPVVVNAPDIRDVNLPSESEPDAEDTNSAAEWFVIHSQGGPEPEPPRATSPISDLAVAEPRATAAASPRGKPEPQRIPVSPCATKDVRLQPSAAKPQGKEHTAELKAAEQKEKILQERIQQEQIMQEIKDSLTSHPPSSATPRRRRTKSVSINDQVIRW